MKRILVVVDMQNDFTTGPLGNAECAAVIPKVAEVIKTGVYDRIIFTQDTHQSNYLDTQEGKRLPVVHCIEGTEGWEIAPVIRKAASFYSKEQIETICKPAFGSVQLGECLKQYCGDAEAQIDFCGVCTGICVISKQVLGENVKIFDGGEGTAREMKRRLQEKDLLCGRQKRGQVVFENSLTDDSKIELCKKLLNI